MKKFSIKIFIMICFCVVLPFTVLCNYIKDNMEHFLQEQISDKVLENLSRDERNIYEELQQMAFFSNSLVCDEELHKRLWDEESSYYENSLYFRELLGRMFLNGQDKIVESAKVILFDTYGRCYSNWGLNFQDYQFLLEEEWVREANESGHITWRMFNPAYIIEDAQDEQYISLVRAVLDEKTAGTRVGTLIMSINREAFSGIMTRYAYEGDKVYVCIDEGQVLMDNDSAQEIGDDEIRTLFGQVEGQRSGMLRQDVKGKEYLINYYTLRKPWEFDGQAIRIFHFTDYREIREQVEGITERISAVILLVLLLILLIAYTAVKVLVRPITVLTTEMNTYSIEKEIRGIDIHRRDEIGELNRAFCGMSDKLKEAFRKAQEDYKVQEQYRYESLRAQLNPHFLFNTLTSIRWMAVIRGAENIVDSIDALAGLLKYSLGSTEELVTIREELEHIRNYVSIQNYRYGEYLTLDIDIAEEIQSWKTMRFILQPVVENAIIHGYGSRDKKRHIIYIYGDREEEHLSLFVEDEGVGISQDQIEQFENGKKGTRKKERQLTGIGLHHVDECIRLTFGEEFGLKIAKNAEKGTIVQFILPILENFEGGAERMKRVMIVDDEFLVRLGIKSLLPWEDYGYEIAGEAENGQEALEKIEIMRPHIILTDLIMNPGDGFMLIEQCKQKYPETKFVVLSNYNDFENVRRAMKLGADDYVFKLTLKDEELLQILDEVSQDGGAGEWEEEKGKEPEGTGRGTVRNRELVKAGILKNLMEAREGYYEVSLKALAEYPCNIDFGEPWRIITITLDDISIARCSGNFLESDLLKFAIENMINEIFEDQGKKEIFQFRECDFILVLCSTEETESFRETMEEEFTRLCQYVQKYCGLHVSGAISPQSRGIHLLRDRIQENELALEHRFWNRQEMLLWTENEAEDMGTLPDKTEADRDGTAVLESRIEEDGIGAGLSCLETLMEERRRICGGDVGTFREFLLALYRVLAWYLKKSGIDLRYILDANGVNLETAIREYDFYEEIRESFIQLREQYLAFYGERQKRPCRKEIVEVKSFVQAHYGEKLSVAQIAAMVNMSESRFAHVFKKEAGISFWEYVNQVRMDQAEKLLRETDLRIGDIAEKIGVDNANYFSAQFKKRKGKSPLAYRNMTEQ